MRGTCTSDMKGLCPVKHVGSGHCFDSRLCNSILMDCGRAFGSFSLSTATNSDFAGAGASRMSL